MPLPNRTFADSSDVPGFLNTLITFVNAQERQVVAINNAAGQSLTAAQILAGTILRSGAAAVTDTLPTAAQIVASVPGAQAGTVLTVMIRNNNTGTLTLGAGTGVTLEGTTTVATANTRLYAVRFINVTPGAEAITVSGLFTAAV